MALTMTIVANCC